MCSLYRYAVLELPSILMVGNSLDQANLRIETSNGITRTIGDYSILTYYCRSVTWHRIIITEDAAHQMLPFEECPRES